MAVWLRLLCLRDMNCTVRDLQMRDSIPGSVKHGVHRTSVKVVHDPQ